MAIFRWFQAEVLKKGRIIEKPNKMSVKRKEIFSSVVDGGGIDQALCQAVIKSVTLPDIVEWLEVAFADEVLGFYTGPVGEQLGRVALGQVGKNEAFESLMIESVREYLVIFAV